MISRLSALALSLLLFCPQPAGAQLLSGRELTKVMKRADKAYADGEGERAAELYEQILASTQPGDNRRANALYALAMARLSPEGPKRDVEAAKRHLGELAEFFLRHPRRLEIAAVRQLLGEIEAARAEAYRRDGEVEARLAEIEDERMAIEAQRQKLAGASQVETGKVKSLQVFLRKTRAELAEAESELEKKEEALQKLKDALVSRAGGP